jgi:hypothetical protein
MLSEAGAGLARADRSIADAERSIRHLRDIVPRIAAQGYPTGQVEDQIEMMMQMLSHLKTQRWHIEGMLGQP